MRYGRARNAALLLGVGLGGFLDGIVLHQVAQQAMPRNMAADGWFPLALWVVTLTGVLLLRSAVRGAGPMPSTRGFVAYLLVGWGAFNLVVGIVAYDWLFLLVAGFGLVALGLALRDRRPLSAAMEAERRSGVDRRAAGR